MIHNPLQVNAKGWPAKRLKSSGESEPKNSKDKSPEMVTRIAIALILGIIHEVVVRHVEFVRKPGIIIYIVQTKRMYNFNLAKAFFINYVLISCM